MDGSVYVEIGLPITLVTELYLNKNTPDSQSPYCCCLLSILYFEGIHFHCYIIISFVTVFYNTWNYEFGSICPFRVIFMRTIMLSTMSVLFLESIRVSGL